jgi:hypothetical protein
MGDTLFNIGHDQDVEVEEEDSCTGAEDCDCDACITQRERMRDFEREIEQEKKIVNHISNGSFAICDDAEEE